MGQEYKRQVCHQSKEREQQNNEDDDDQIKKEQQKGIWLLQKTHKQIINLCSLLNFENITVALFMFFLIIPLLSTYLYLYLSLYSSQASYFLKLIFCLICLNNLRCKFTLANLTLELLQNENKTIKYVLLLSDLENVYIMIKHPNSLPDLLKDKMEMLLEMNSFSSNSLLQLNFFIALKSFDYVTIFFQVFYSQALIAFIIQKYSKMCPHSNNQTLQSWLCNKNFAISILHGFTFYQLLILNLQAVGYIVYFSGILYVISVIVQLKKITLSPYYYHIVNDIPFIQENLTKPYLLKQGYVRLTNRIGICIIQKIIIISLAILGLLKLEFYNSYYTFNFTLCFIFLSILSLFILQKRYRHQRNLIYGQYPQLIEINSEKEFKQLLNEGITQDSQKYLNLQVINVTEKNIKTEDKIHLLFFCFQKSDVFFKGKDFQRYTLKNKLFQAVTINSTFDLYYLDQINNKYRYLNSIQSLNPVEKQLLLQPDFYKKLQEVFDNQNLVNIIFGTKKKSILNNIQSITPLCKRQQIVDIYQKLVKSDIILQIKEIQNDNCPFLQTYKNYANEIQSVLAQIQVFDNLIAQYILNNANYAYFDLYD